MIDKSYGAKKLFRFHGSYLNRWIQPDSDVPESQGVHAFDRYAYTSNNPIRYTDPTGHRNCEEDGYNCSANNSTTVTEKALNGDNNDNIKNSINEGIVTTLESLATGTQDIATIIDLTFAIPEVVIGTIGVVTGGPETIPVTVGGMDILFNVFLGNAAETGLSGASLLFTGLADLADNGQFGDSTMTSAVTFGVGLGMPDPVGDLMIDSYASGYNHGIFNGFTDIINGLPLFKNWP